MLSLSPVVHLEIVGHAYDELPNECCGLLIGDPVRAQAFRYYRCRNTEESSRIYTIDGRDHLAADRAADDAGQEIIGVVHSHTHTAPYPSPTDVAAAPVPDWHYVIVSLADEVPTLRSYRIIDGQITEEDVAV